MGAQAALSAGGTHTWAVQVNPPAHCQYILSLSHVPGLWFMLRGLTDAQSSPYLWGLLTREGHGAQRWRVSYSRRLETLRGQFCGGKKLRIVSREVARGDGEGTTSPEGMSGPWCTCCSLTPLVQSSVPEIVPSSTKRVIPERGAQGMGFSLSKGGDAGAVFQGWHLWLPDGSWGPGHSSMCLWVPAPTTVSQLLALPAPPPSTPSLP